MPHIIINASRRTQWTGLVIGRYVIIVMMLLCYINLSGGQVCTDNVNIYQDGRDQISRDSLAIIPRLSFSCNGVITSITARVRFDDDDDRTEYPIFQVWRPSSVGSTVYNKTGEVQLQSDQVTGSGDYRTAYIPLTGNNTIEFWSGDVVGYYHPPQSRYRVRTIRTDGYRLYEFERPSASTTLYNLNDADDDDNDRQPLIQFTIDNVTCEDLDTPANGSINCSSDDRPLQYQDSCTIQCNDGYELQGSVIRQCEASGQWSGSRTQCNIRHCPDITGLVLNSRSCDTSYTSTCIVECEDGYIISGDSSQYSCGLNGTEVAWMFNGSGVTCSPVPCWRLNDPENGNVTCPSNTSVFQDTCTYYCNRGYQLEGNGQTRCDADGTWSSEPVTCTILKCNDPEVEIANSQSVGACNVTYGSSCSLNCSSGFSASGNGEHVCDDVNDEGTSVKWRSVGGAFSCVSAETSSNNSSSGESTITIVAGSVGGAAFFTIVILLSFVILCHVRHFYKKRSLSFINETVNELDSQIKININPSYSIVAQNKKQYDYVVHNKFSPQDIKQDAIKMESNPSYGIVQGCDTPDYHVSTEANLTNNSILKEPSMMSEDDDQHGYVETNSYNVQGTGYLKVVSSTTKEGEPVYDVATDDISNVELTPNPSYGTV